jgi:hypothetical protein
MQCFTQTDKLLLQVKFAFNGIQRIEKSHENGTICLSIGGPSTRTSGTRRHDDDSSWERRLIRPVGSSSQNTQGSTGSELGTSSNQGLGVVLATGRPPTAGAAEKERAVQACREFVKAKRSDHYRQTACPFSQKLTFMMMHGTHSLIHCIMCRGDSGPDISHWEDSLLRPIDAPEYGRESHRVNLTNCEELEAAIDEFCTFDADAVRDFTADVKKNGGEFSIGFWVKPLGDESLMSAEKFYPHVTFFGSLSAPRPQLQLGKV